MGRPMSYARWQQVKDVLGGALEHSDRSAQHAFLSHACATDPALRAEVESLLSQTTSPLETGARQAALAGTEDSSTASDAGRRAGAWALQRELGRGGMGTVWLARRADGRFEQIGRSSNC